MWWRAPWLKHRWRLLGLAVLDGAWILFAYNLFCFPIIHRWAGITKFNALLTTSWLVISYLTGRYSATASQGSESIPKKLLLTLAAGTAILILVVFFLYWGFQLQDPRVFPKFALPLLTMVLLGSGIFQILSCKLQFSDLTWVIIASKDEINILSTEIKYGLGQKVPDVLFMEDSCLGVENLELSTSTTRFAISDNATISDQTIENLIEQRSRGARVDNLVNWCEQYLQRIPPEIFSTRWLIQAEGFDLQPQRFHWRVKRFGDIALSLLLLVLTSPLIIISALAIKLSDNGPIFFGQIRTGLYGKPYKIWKLRTMKPTSHGSSSTWALPNDSRITPIGRWLRLFRIDELPQLTSVLSGDMSLIGPRPELPNIDEYLEKKLDHYRVRHCVRPGLSGWAQVCFPYGASVADSRMKLSYDLYYLRNANVVLDLFILLKTFKLVLLGQGSQPRPDVGA